MTYEEFEKHMAEKYPRYCGENARFGGYAIGEGWYPIIEQLIAEIDYYTKWRRNTRAYELKRQRAKKHGVEGVLKFMVKPGRTPTEWDIENAENIMKQEQKFLKRLTGFISNRSKRSLVDFVSTTMVVMNI